MSRVEQIEQRIAELDPIWDRQIENYSKSGRLRWLIEQALDDDRAGRSTDL